MLDNQVQKSRIDVILDITKLDPIELAKLLGVSKEYIYMLQNGKRSISKKLANKIESVFGIDTTFSLGEENALPELIVNPNEWKDSLSNISNNSSKGVPFYDIDVTATLAESYLDSKEVPEYYVDFPPFNDCDAFTRVYGDSMYPKYQSGEIIAIKKLSNLDIMRWGETHLIVTDSYYDNLRTIKNIHPCENDEDSIVIEASNPKFKGTNKILKKHILGLFLVKGKASVHHM